MLCFQMDTAPQDAAIFDRAPPFAQTFVTWWGLTMDRMAEGRQAFPAR